MPKILGGDTRTDGQTQTDEQTGIDRHTDREQSDLISFLLFFKIRKVG
jgi:hypothetical protein